MPLPPPPKTVARTLFCTCIAPVPQGGGAWQQTLLTGAQEHTRRSSGSTLFSQTLLSWAFLHLEMAWDSILSSRHGLCDFWDLPTKRNRLSWEKQPFNFPVVKNANEMPGALGAILDYLVILTMEAMEWAWKVEETKSQTIFSVTDTPALTGCPWGVCVCVCL